MPRPILVVGLSGRNTLSDLNQIIDGRVVLARHSQSTEGRMPVGVALAHAYDDLFERNQLTAVASDIANDLLQRAGSTDVAYLVPGPGWFGDATVAALNEQTTIEVAPAPDASPLPAHAQVVDALLLAQAQERAPFDSGDQPLDATVPTVVCNWFGDRVTNLAAERLRAIYGVTELPDPAWFGTMTVLAHDVLDGPASFAALAKIVARLRLPDGCPWDREQTHASLLKSFASEVDEFAEAVRAEDWTNAAEELGDVLVNILMQSQIGAEAGHFRIEDVLASINAKLVRRHPHVFAGVEAACPEDVLAVWNSVKQQERQTNSYPSKPGS